MHRRHRLGTRPTDRRQRRRQELAGIAVSVMAEILAVKNAVALPRESDVANAKTAQKLQQTMA